MAFLQRVNYLGKFTTLFILTGISFAFIVLFILYVEFINFQKNIDIQKAQHEVLMKQTKTNDFYNRFEKFLATIEHNRFFTSYLDTPSIKNKDDLITLFTTLTEHEKHITQLRYLDINGQEIVRVDRNKSNENISLVPTNKLQNKKHRGYFIKTMEKKEGEIFVSKLDLNIENKKIEFPYKPVWRFAIPVVYENQKRGIIIVNIFAQYLLDEIVKSESFIVDIYDQDGDILVSSDNSKNNWTKYLKTKPLLQKDRFLFNDILIDGINDEVLNIAMTQKDWITSFFKILNFNILLLVVFIIFISFVLAHFLAKIPKKLFNELEEQQNMLIQQSKVAAMGEMTAMLAHQWRQPINAVSVLLQEMQIKQSMDMLNQKEFDTLYLKVDESLKYMSKTIDNFRDFFRNDKVKDNFNIYNTIEESYSILDMKLGVSSIKYKIEKVNYINSECTEIYGSEGEFKQVIVNIINNAIEAIDLQNKKQMDYYINTFVECDNMNIKVMIKDNGGGIDTQVIDKLFQPYSSTKLEQNGSGLGLYMSKMIIEKNMNGSIKAYNKDGGAVFDIKLPKSNSIEN